MPCRLATAATGSRSASRMIATICSSENRPFRIAPSESGASLNRWSENPRAGHSGIPLPASAGGAQVTYNDNYKANFRSLVPGGFFSSDPDDLSAKRSIRTNNPGALNISTWQKQFPGYVGVTQADAAGNVTTIYVTPENGVGAWYYLLTDRYQFGDGGSLTLKELEHVPPQLNRGDSREAKDRRVLSALIRFWEAGNAEGLFCGHA